MENQSTRVLSTDGDKVTAVQDKLAQLTEELDWLMIAGNN